MVTFERPVALILLAAGCLPWAFAWWAGRKNGDWLKRSEERAQTCLYPLFRVWQIGKSIATGSLLLQSLAIIAAAAAIANPSLSLGGRADRPYLLLHDESASAARLRAQPLDWPDSLPRLDYSFAGNIHRWPGRPSGSALNQTHITGALLLAAAAERPAGVIIHTDGQFQDNRNKWQKSAELLGKSGLDVIVVPIDSPPPDARVSSVTAARKFDSKVNLRITVKSNATQRRKLVVHRIDADAEKLLLERRLNLISDDIASVNLTDVCKGDRTVIYRARLVPADAFAENDSASALLIPARRRIAVVGDTTGRLRRCLAGATDIPVDSAPSSITGWLSYACVVLVNSNPRDFAPDQAESLAEYVRGGGGLVLIGSGPRSSPAGRDNALNRVAALTPNPYQRQAMNVIVVLDASGSMAGVGAGDKKFHRALQAVVSLKRHLTAGDTLEVITFSDTARRVFRGQATADEFLRLGDTLADIRPQGKTAIGPALTLAIKGTDVLIAKKTLVLVVSDLMTKPFDVGAAVRGFRRRGISLAVAAIVRPDRSRGDAGLWPLEMLAQKLNAPLAKREHLSALAEVFAEFLTGARGDAIRRGRFKVKPVGSPFGLKPASQLEVDAYIPCAAGESARVLVRVGSDPLIALRRVALGRSVTLALSAEPNSNAAWWSSRFGKTMIAKAVQWATSSRCDPRFSGKIIPEDEGLTVRLQARDKSKPVNLLNLSAYYYRYGASTQAGSATMLQDAPGSYVGRIAAAPGAGNIQVRDAAGKKLWQCAMGEHCQPEFSAIGPNWPNLRRLAKLTGGRIVPAERLAGWAKKANAKNMQKRTHIWPYLLIAAIVLMMLDWKGIFREYPARKV